MAWANGLFPVVEKVVKEHGLGTRLRSRGRALSDGILFHNHPIQILMHVEVTSMMTDAVAVIMEQMDSWLGRLKQTTENYRYV